VARSRKPNELPPKPRSNPSTFDVPRLVPFPDIVPNNLANEWIFSTLSEIWYRTTPKPGWRFAMGSGATLQMNPQMYPRPDEWRKIASVDPKASSAPMCPEGWPCD
jgi:hypothetical protein